MDVSKIDFSKAPEGATHYSPETDKAVMAWYKPGFICIPSSFDSWSKYGARVPDAAIKIPLTQDCRWTIYNNDKPLGDLTRDQRLELMDAWFCGGEVEMRVAEAWIARVSPKWEPVARYRIKQKSERDAFIDAAVNLITSETERTMEQMFGELYDSGKFKYIDNTQYFGEQI